MSKKLDLFGLLDKIDGNDLEAYLDLTDEERKEFAPVVVMRWLSSSMDTKQLTYLNEYVNRHVFHHYRHPDLMFKVMVACTPPKKHYYKWLPRKKKDKLTKKVDVVTRYLECSRRDAKEYLTSMTQEDVLTMAQELGDPSTYITELKAEFK